MEMNKGEAEKCRDIAKKFLRAGKYAQAIKFFDKSHRMFPLPGVEAMSARAREELAKAEAGPSASASASGSGAAAPPSSSAGSDAGMRRRQTSSSSATDESARPYTPDQVQIVNKIRACKSHYDVLSVAQGADDATIKKAYRKLALKLHPDKNSAPGAEDAFKAVGKAFTILSDPDKRAHYDRYGDSVPGASPQARARRHQEEDISPEEIFNMFFGGGFRPRRHPRQQQQRHAAGAVQDQRTTLMQFLPLLLIFLLSMLSIPGTPDVPFSMQPNAQYNIQRETKMASVAKGIPYFVDREFDRKYTSHWRDLQRVEQMVEQYHMSRLAETCENLKIKQKRMIYRARNSKSEDREAKMRAALEMRMPACEQLKTLRRSRNR